MISEPGRDLNDLHADVVISGGGPAGATAAWHLASTGVDVLVLEKTAFPRDKVCGDGLTPQAVRELDLMGIDTASPQAAAQGWKKIKGLRLVAEDRAIEVPWPDTKTWPSYSLVRTRSDFDFLLAQHARSAGARILERHAVAEVVHNDSGRVVGVRAEVLNDKGRKTGEFRTVHAKVVLAADGNSTRTAKSAGLHRREDRPMAVAVRAYYTSPRHDDDYLESWLRLPDAHGNPLPGYGWLFPLGDGTVNVGLGVLDTSAQFRGLNYRNVLHDWTGVLTQTWQISEDVRVSPMGSAALPMAFNRTPQFVPGMLLLGDSAGMVSPFNGEGISFAMEAARMAADVTVTALNTGTVAGMDAQLSRYPKHTQQAWGAHFALGVQFANIIGQPEMLHAALALGFSNPPLLKAVVQAMSNVVDSSGGGFVDRGVRLLESLTPVPSTQKMIKDDQIPTMPSRIG